MRQARIGSLWFMPRRARARARAPGRAPEPRPGPERGRRPERSRSPARADRESRFLSPLSSSWSRPLETRRPPARPAAIQPSKRGAGHGRGQPPFGLVTVGLQRHGGGSYAEDRRRDRPGEDREELGGVVRAPRRGGGGGGGAGRGRAPPPRWPPGLPLVGAGRAGGV